MTVLAKIGDKSTEISTYEEAEELGIELIESIELVDASQLEEAIARREHITPHNLKAFLALAELSEEAQVAVYFLTDDLGYTLENAIDRVGEVCLYEGSAADYAYDLAEDLGAKIPDWLVIDWHATGRDLIASGDICEVWGGYVVTNPQAL